MAESLLDIIDFYKRLDKDVDRAAQLAINTIANRGGLNLIRNDMLKEIAFPKDYLTGDRLGVTQLAKPGNLEAVIRARKRATSLARFAPGQPLGSKAKLGVRVTVGKGGTTVLRQAWLVRLQKGASLTEDNFNVGLAVRVKPGESIQNKKSTQQAWLVPDRVALLFGPSVDQVFREVSEQVAEPIAELLQTEFLRQLSRDL